MAQIRKILSNEDLSERIGDFLRRMHPVKTAHFVESQTGISSRTVDKWLSKSSCPNGPAYDALLRCYGPGFLCALHPKDSEAWFEKAAREETNERLRRELADLEAQLADLNAIDAERSGGGSKP